MACPHKPRETGGSLVVPDLDRRAIDPVAPASRAGATCVRQFAVDMQHRGRSGALVQRINVLRDHDHLVLSLERGNGEMGRIRPGLPRPGTPFVVELENERGVCAPTFRASQVLPGMLTPQSGRITKCRQAALSGKPGAREDDYFLAHARGSRRSGASTTLLAKLWRARRKTATSGAATGSARSCAARR